MDSKTSSPSNPSVVIPLRVGRSAAVLVAAISFAAFVALGLAVHRYGEPAALLAFDRALFDHGAGIAWWFTELAKFYALSAIFVALLVVALLRRAWRGEIVFSLVMLVLAWRAADFFQHVFARSRPTDWVMIHETTFSYPSSHATIAVAFYALWAWLLARRPQTQARRVVSFALALLALAICWSRLALGAHFVTDVAGGALLGLTLLAAGVAVWPEILVRGRREPA